MNKREIEFSIPDILQILLFPVIVDYISRVSEKTASNAIKPLTYPRIPKGRIGFESYFLPYVGRLKIMTIQPTTNLIITTGFPSDFNRISAFL